MGEGGKGGWRGRWWWCGVERGRDGRDRSVCNAAFILFFFTPFEVGRGRGDDVGEATMRAEVGAEHRTGRAVELAVTIESVWEDVGWETGEVNDDALAGYA